MFTICFSENVPNSTYFRVGDAEPYIENGNLVVLDGVGTSRSWGHPGVNSTIVHQDETLMAVHVGFYHKHGGSQFWRFYRFQDNQIVRVTWAKLSDEERIVILNSEKGNAPYWANCPGGLRSERQKPQKLEKGCGYKLVGVRNGKFISLYDEETEYKIGVTLTEEALPNHRGGYYFYKNIAFARQLKADSSLTRGFYKFALMLVRVEGNIIDYGNKYAASSMTPVKIIEQF
jgi:hypothetical protein